MTFSSVHPVSLLRFFHLINSLSLCFLYYFHFHFQVLFLRDLLTSSSFVCVSLDFFKEVFYFLFKNLYHLHKIILMSFSCVSVALDCSGLAVIGFLVSLFVFDRALTLAFIHLDLG